jgi:hypothetical protein
MNAIRKIRAALLYSCFVYLLCGCVSSYLVEKWNDATFQSSPLSRMLVIHVTKNAAQRCIWEDAFAGALAKHALSAVASYGLFPDAPPDTNQVIEVVKTNGFNGIVVILTGKPLTNLRYIQGYTTTEKTVREVYPGDHYRMSSDEVHYPENYSYWQRYRTCYLQIDHPGYVDSQTVDLRTIDVSTTGKKARLIWSATSRTPDPASVSRVQGEIAGLVVDDLLQKHIIGLGLEK